jgi:predicted nucleotidyltransferase
MSKTALELSPQEWQRYHPAEAIVRRKQQDQAQVAQRKQRAWQLARQAAELLRNDFGAKKIVVFGSLAHEAWFTPWSDIDLAAWGIPADRFYSAVGSVAEFSPEFKVEQVGCI